MRVRPSTSTRTSAHLGGRQLPIAISGVRSWSSRNISLRMNQRGALAQPAVAPLPLTCRKIAPPRCLTWLRLKLVTTAHSYWCG